MSAQSAVTQDSERRPSCGPATSENTQQMAPFWCFFKFHNAKLEEQFWDSKNQQSRHWWIGTFSYLHLYALFQIVQHHLRGESAMTILPAIISCGTCFLLLVLNFVSHRWSRHMGHLNAIVMPVLGALAIWSINETLSFQISEIMDLTMADTTPVCADPEIASIHAEIVRMLVERLKAEIVNHHISLGIMFASSALVVLSVNVDWCKTAFLSITVSFIMALLWLIFIPFAPLSSSGTKMIPMVGLLFLLPIAVVLAVTSDRRKIFLVSFLREKQSEEADSGSQEADSILNHTLKNTMSDAAGQLEIFLDDPNCSKDVGASTIQNLKLALASLQRGMKCCRNRQTYISLVSGTYTSVQSVVNLSQFLSDVTMGRAITVEKNQGVEDEILLDPVLMDLILDNAIANAIKHGDPSGPDVRLIVKRGRNQSIVFQITNVANPKSKVLSAQFVQSMLHMGHKHRRSNDLMSSGIGLQHAQRAALCSGTEIDLWQEDRLVIFQAVSQHGSVPLPRGNRYEQEDAADVSAFPEGLHFCCIDDAPLSLRTMEYGLLRHAAAGKVETYGQNGPDDVPRFMDQAPKADIIIFDANIDFPGNHISGIELLRTIKAGGFRGLLVVRSGNTSDDDCLQYQEAGCHCVLGKELPMSKATVLVKQAYLWHKSAAQLHQAQSSCSVVADTL